LTLLTTRLTTPRLAIELMAPSHAAMLAEFFRRNDAHLRPWDPPRPRGIAEPGFWEGETARAGEDFLDGGVARWVAFARDDLERIIARANFTQIVRGPFQSCMLGYAIDRQFEGRGLMHEALQATLRYAFETLRLHRVQANHLPENDRSARLLQRLGFRVEGLARDYLFINGTWRDHVLTALTTPQFDATVFSTPS
jgi:ribosomal-protein-alanine N-acetyltransferase